MESYAPMDHRNSSDSASFPAYLTSAAPNRGSHHHHHYQMDMNTFVHLQSAHPEYFQSPAVAPEHHPHHPSDAVKIEGGSTAQRIFQSHPLAVNEVEREGSKNATDTNSHTSMEGMKAKIMAHPQYSNLLEAYTDCQKVGAPPELAAKLSAVRQDYHTTHSSSSSSSSRASKDPELDQFMEAYYDMLVKYREELARPVEEAMDFMRTIESQLSLLSNGAAFVINSDKRSTRSGSSYEDADNSSGREASLPGGLDPLADEQELKNHLLSKYSGYLSSLKQQLSKKKKKGKLPNEARQKLVSWWELHYKWPYPSESEKVALAEATGLDQKQINNWFINQRKRHWKPSEDMQFMVMEGLHHQQPRNAAALYMEANAHNYMGDFRYPA